MKIRRWFSENLSFGRKYLKTTQRDLTFLIKEATRQMASVNLWDKTLHCEERGVSDESLCEEEVIVSLTSHGNRVHDAHLAIESIMQQTVLPNRIVLWLSKDEFQGKTLPIALQRQVERGLEIAYCEDLRSYTKLIPSLKRFPEACIITVDDDLAYRPDLLEKLIRSHISHPSDICASRIHRIVLDAAGRPVPYDNWNLCFEECPEENNLVFFTGCGGVLYPPDCFPEEVFNREVYLNVCPSADDVWFNAMRLLGGIRVTKVYSPTRKGDYLELPSSFVNPLWETNQKTDNDLAIAAVYGRYGLFEKLKGNN
jgi:hypothetical protein